MKGMGRRIASNYRLFLDSGEHYQEPMKERSIYYLDKCAELDHIRSTEHPTAVIATITVYTAEMLIHTYLMLSI